VEWYCGWREIVYTAVWNDIVGGGRLYIQRYGMVLWLEGDCIYSGMEWYCGWREISVISYPPRCMVGVLIHAQVAECHSI